MVKKILIIFPNTVNLAVISMAVPILGGIAKSKGWEVNYFDSHRYVSNVNSVTERQENGGFRPGGIELENNFLPVRRPFKVI